MLINIRRLPRIADPDIPYGPRRIVPPHDLLGQSALLLLILVVQHKDTKRRLLALPSALLLRLNDILFQLAHCIFKRGARVVDLVDDEDVFADEAGHLERGEVEPLRTCYFCAGSFDLRVDSAEGLIEGEADGLDGDVGRAGCLEEGARLFALAFARLYDGT